MSLQSARQVVLGFHPQRPVVMEASAAPLSSDGGLLVVRECDERIGLTARFAAALEDTRDPAWTRQSVLSMVRRGFRECSRTTKIRTITTNSAAIRCSS